MVEITFLEVNLGEASLNTPFGASGGEEAKSEETAVEVTAGESEEPNTGRPSVLPPLIGLLVLVGLAVAVRKLRGGGEEEMDDEVAVETEELTA